MRVNPAELIRLAKEKFPKKSDLNKISEALRFATEKHSGQKRLSGEDYISHPIAVAALLIEWDMDVDSVVAGLLHDVVEDTDVELSEIADKIAQLTSESGKVEKSIDALATTNSQAQKP